MSSLHNTSYVTSDTPTFDYTLASRHLGSWSSLVPRRRPIWPEVELTVSGCDSVSCYCCALRCQISKGVWLPTCVVEFNIVYLQSYLIVI